MKLESRSADAIRSAFLDFFGKRGHSVVPSAPLLPQNDPTLMFVNAGMVPFKDVFTGAQKRDDKRAASSQKCIRISGKHNDLENVGVTARHQTFFEMLGNFSFGDYFKEEAIVSAWELLTDVFGVPKERLLITVFEGAEGFAADDEAAELWRKVTGFGDDRIRRLGMDDNFWTMGDTGPCGPCSEIHFFHGPEVDLGRFGEEPPIDGTGWTEIWNLVFMQYNRAAKDAAPTPLPAPSIDTGMGLERIASVVQGVTSNYDTDLLRVLVDRASEIAQKTYRGSTADDDVSMRVLADHARTTAFLMAEGVMPDKQRREYVLRRVMRRAIRHGHRLGIERPFLHELALLTVETMGDTYPELRERKELIARTTEDEEVRFRATLKRGMKILDEHFNTMRSKGERQLDAATAADLYTTYGFPLDLTELICQESNFSADVDGAKTIVHGADAADGPIDPDAALDPAYREVKERVGNVAFDGYENEALESEIVALLMLKTVDGRTKREVVESANAGDEVEVVTKRTPMYAEGGGQVGDRGTISCGEALVEVRDTQRPLDGLIVHHGKLQQGALRVGDRVSMRVDGQARTFTRRNHSATHLLHWALRKVLGEHAAQKGSRVGPDVLRFDFAHNQPLTRDQTRAIEDLVNEKILVNAPVLTEVLPIDEAKKRGAVAIFEEKYGDVVRVLTMTKDSVELCGGTHVRALGDIGLFRIESEGGVAAGVRRIFASTGQNARSAVRAMEDELAEARTIVKAQSGDFVEKLSKLSSREKELERRVAELERKLLEGGGGGMDAMLGEAQEIGGVRVLSHRAPDGTQPGALRELAEKLRDKLGDSAAVLVGAIANDKAMLALMLSKAVAERVQARELIKPVAAHVGGSGGGRHDMAQAGGTDIDGIDRSLSSLYDEIRTRLGS